MPKLVIHQEKVEDPQVLVDICPFGAMEEKDGKLSINAACKMCKLCVKKGPAGAVEYVEDEKKEEIDNLEIEKEDIDYLDYFNSSIDMKINKPKKTKFLYKTKDIFLIDKKLLFIGTLNRSIVHPREIFKHAYLLSASSIICVHNHPSGDTIPSKEDMFLTKNLVEIGKMQGIAVVDHIIVGNNYYSFFENGDI